MQIMKYASLAVLALFSLVSNAQNLTSREVQTISDALFVKLNADSTVQSVVIRSFHFFGDTASSELGEYLAKQVQLQLDKPQKKFSVIDRSKIKELFSEVRMGESGLTDGNGPKLGRLRGIHMVIDGTMQLTGNYIELAINTTQLETGTASYTAQGYITITPSLQKMIQPATKKTGSGTSKTTPKTTATSPLPFYGTYRKNDLRFDLTKCEKKGRYIECVMLITNEGREDVQLHIYRDRSRIINKDQGIEYFISSLKMADKSNSDHVDKTIVAKSAITAIFTFDKVIDAVNTLSKLELHCWASSLGSFTVELIDIPVPN